MKIKGIIAIGLVMLSACGGTERDKKEIVAPVAVEAEIDTAAYSKAWKDYMTPGAPHAKLAGIAGKWQAIFAVYPVSGGDPFVYNLTGINTMILEGKFLQVSFKGVMGGAPFESMATIGYDNNRKLYTSTWMDSMGTGVINLEGNMSADGEQLILVGKTREILTEKEIEVKQVIRFLSDKTLSIEMYDKKAGAAEVKTVSIGMKRI